MELRFCYSGLVSYSSLRERGGLTSNETGEPAVEDPDHRSAYDTSKVRRLVDAVSVSFIVEEDTGYDLRLKREFRRG